MSQTLTQQGYLVIADITGYTSFVAKTELEHSQEILAELLGLIVGQLETLLSLNKLEGDAAFAYLDKERLSRGETLLELFEATYCAFRDKQQAMQRATTCTCNACRNIPSLDLKFFTHYGDYIFQQVGSTREVVGSDVNLIHRLTKNHVAEATGWRAYILFTEQCVDHLGLVLEDVHRQVETYEHLGDVLTLSLDLHTRYDQIVSARRVVIPEAEADVVLTVDFSSPPATTWEWINDPAKRNLWSTNVHWSAGERPGGRTGTGALNHCAHGKGSSTQVILDWRPFEYATSESSQDGVKSMTETARLEPLPGGGTRLYNAIRINSPLPAPLRRLAARFFMKKFKYAEQLMEAARMAGEESQSE